MKKKGILVFWFLFCFFFIFLGLINNLNSQDRIKNCTSDTVLYLTDIERVSRKEESGYKLDRYNIEGYYIVDGVEYKLKDRIEATHRPVLYEGVQMRYDPENPSKGYCVNSVKYTKVSGIELMGVCFMMLLFFLSPLILRGIRFIIKGKKGQKINTIDVQNYWQSQQNQQNNYYDDINRY